MQEHSVIGKSPVRVDAAAKATGEAKYTVDVTLPRLLHGKILRSPYAHARILGIDTSKARALPGVKAIITGQDTNKEKYGVFPSSADQCPLAVDKACYIGDAVAAVAAVDEDVAEEALRLIQVDYEELPAVFSVEEALRPEAPRINWDGNVGYRVNMNLGDVERGFAESDVILEDKYESPGAFHAHLEPYSVVASYDAGSGQLTAWMPNTQPWAKRRFLSRALGLPLTNIRVIGPLTGGAFGGRGEMFNLEFCAALLSIKARRPVRIEFTREESLTNTVARHTVTFDMKTGAKKDGTLTAIQCRAMLNTGPYNGVSPVPAFIIGDHLTMVYHVPNLRYEGLVVQTNLTPRSAMRGLGSLHAVFAHEQHLDQLAEKLGIDALQIRLKNAIHTGDVATSGARITSCGLSTCLEKAARAIGWDEKPGANTNRGKAIVATGCMVGTKNAPESGSAAIVRVNEDGRATLLTGMVETGNGNFTVLAQIVAEELRLTPQDVHVTAGDTDTTMPDLGTYTMGGTLITGNAVKKAAIDAREQLFNLAANMLEANAQDLEIRDGLICVKGSPERGITLGRAALAGLHTGNAVIGRGSHPLTCDRVYKPGEFKQGQSSPTYSFSAQAVEVEVDRETGQVKLLRSVTAHDCGKAINPMGIEGQVEGGVSMNTMGAGLMEEMQFDDGRVLNPSLLTYGVTTSLDMCDVETIIVESNDPEGPYGAKEAGEGHSHMGPAVLANAIYNAIGVRIKSHPITPEKILKALESSGQ